MSLQEALRIAPEDPATGCRWAQAKHGPRRYLAVQWPTGEVLAEVRHTRDEWQQAKRLTRGGPARWWPVRELDPCRL